MTAWRAARARLAVCRSERHVPARGVETLEQQHSVVGAGCEQSIELGEPLDECWILGAVAAVTGGELPPHAHAATTIKIAENPKCITREGTAWAWQRSVCG